MNLKNQVKFGQGQPTDRGGRPKKNSVLIELEAIAESEGKMILEPFEFEVLPDGSCEVRLPTQQMIAIKLLQMAMKGDARFFDIYFKLTGAYTAQKHDVTIEKNPLGGKNFDRLSDADRKILLSLGEKV